MSDKLIREYDDHNAHGAWVGKKEYEDGNGNIYTICSDQDGGEWIEE